CHCHPTTTANSFRCRKIRPTRTSRAIRSDRKVVDGRLFATTLSSNRHWYATFRPVIPEARMAKGPAVISGGLVLAATGQVAPSDLLLEDDLIAAIAPPGSATSASARRIDAANRLIIPGLINA